MFEALTPLTIWPWQHARIGDHPKVRENILVFKISSGSKKKTSALA